MKILIPLLMLCLRAPAADLPVVHELSIVAGKGELLQFDRDVAKVAIAEPKIADAQVISPRDVMVNAKIAGHTTVVIWQTDAPPARYEITVRSDTTEVDSLLNTLGSELKSSLPNSGIEFSGNAETIVLTGRVDNTATSKRAEAVASVHAKKVVNMLQVPDPRQILLQVKFASVDRTALSQIGFNLFSLNSKTQGGSSTQQFPAPLFTQLQGQGATGPGVSNVNISNLLNLFIFRPDLDLGATVAALEQQNLLQVLAEPNLIVVEGAEASFLAGGEFPFPTITSTPTGSGIAPVITVQFKKYGVQLNFTPTLTASGAINLKVKPEVSSLDFTNAVTLQGFLIPAISSRVAETEVVLKEGESFAIAGLIDNRVTEVMSKVPFLGDIPILGTLFRSRSTQKTATELLVVITPRLVSPVSSGEKVTLPTYPATFLPPAKPPVPKGKKKDKKADGSEKKPEFVGPTGHEVPN